jgi:hypothetical protein
MLTIVRVMLQTVRALFRTRATLQLERFALRHQRSVLERTRRRRVARTRADRQRWVWLSRMWPRWRTAVVLVPPETVVAWHRHGFRLWWRWKSRRRAGRPGVSADVRALIRSMAAATPLWGAPRLHGELLTRGIAVSQATVATYLPRRRPPSPTWRTFLRTHADQIVAADVFVVPTVTYRLLFVLVRLAHHRRRGVHVAVTAHPTAAWTAQQ